LTQWSYRGVYSETRIRVLETVTPFENIVHRLNQDMHIVCCHTQECEDKQGYKRVVYCAEVDRELFDVFFNSCSGYRGAYFQSPEYGLTANQILLRTVAQRLTAWTRTYCSDQDYDLAARSLLATSAKAWLAEETLKICGLCRGEWNPSVQTELEIINGRWECDAHTHAQWGRQTPLFKKIRFFGAFLDDSGNEYVALHKQCRAEEIHARGWS
jgi:hypothetical protein